MRNVFISHVEEDQAIALELARGLEAAGYTTWYFERDSLPGLSYLEQIDEAIEQCQAILIIISRDSISSRQVDIEVQRAHESAKHFIPVLRGIQHVEFQKQKRVWRMAMGTTTSLLIPADDVSMIIARIVAGLRKLTLEPIPPVDDEESRSGNEVDFEQLLEQFEQEEAALMEGEIVRGTVVGIRAHAIYIDFGHKSIGIADPLEFIENYNLTVKLGDEVEVVVKDMDTGDGLPLLSRAYRNEW